MERRSPEAVTYARTTHDDGRRSWDSIEDQQHANAATATRLGVQVVAGFVDVGVSGNVTNRPGLNHLLAWIDEQRVNYVIVNSIDRLARKSVHLAYLLNEFEDRGASALLADRDTVVELVLPSNREVRRGDIDE